ncbi:MAG: hypothetical protein CMF25_05685 [Kangiellaceae bacterium]|nr:hypothetical protein [Kangiellaceae bacterium]
MIATHHPSKPALEQILRYLILSIGFIVILVSQLALATSPKPQGRVEVPLSTYEQLIKQGQQPPLSTSYALGRSELEVQVRNGNNHQYATIVAEVDIDILEPRWTSVPLLGIGATITRAEKNGQPIQLVPTLNGHHWLSQEQGTHHLSLHYQVSLQQGAQSNFITLPIPEAAVNRLRLTVPEPNLDIAITPATAMQSQSTSTTTHVSADIPTSSQLAISWRSAQQVHYSMSRAHYQGKVLDDAIEWQGMLDVEVFHAKAGVVPILPNHVTLTEVLVDNKPASVRIEEGFFAVPLVTEGKHQIQVKYQIPIQRDQGQPVAITPIPKVPMSSFSLSLPGKKALQVEPRTAIEYEQSDNQTQAKMFIPMTDRVSLSWQEAVPEDVTVEARANAAIYHGFYAEEGVVHAKAVVHYDITRGETSSFILSVPSDVQVNKLNASVDGLSDWVVAGGETPQDHKTLTLFFNRKITGKVQIHIDYEKLFSTEEKQPLPLPLLQADNVHRQRGMIALLASNELSLKPEQTEHLSKVGENQLPADVRNAFAHGVAHTYKYSQTDARISVVTMAPERKQGKFDAQIHTLISIGEVAIKGTSTVKVAVKSGALAELVMTLPNDVSLLSLSGPSIRNHKTAPHQDRQQVHVEFTQEMAGQFNIDLQYEQLIQDQSKPVTVPRLNVQDAQVEHGKVAIEALTAVEVQALETQQLSTVDINELPQQLILKTTNPILLAYKYLHAEPPYSLILKITRHQEMDVQNAVIDQAHYHTLVTNDGLRVTRAQLNIRNSRRQFLRMTLPEGASVWSLTVNHRAEKPAIAGNDANTVLVKLINSHQGFPIELVYAVPSKKMAFRGNINASLPMPDMLAGKTLWDIYLPYQYEYGKLDSSMNESQSLTTTNPQQKMQAARSLPQAPGFPIAVPSQGVHFQLEQLYASESGEVPTFSISYTSEEGVTFGSLLTIVGTLLLWLGLSVLLLRPARVSATMAAGLMATGAIATAVAFSYLASPTSLASLTSIICLAVLAGIMIVTKVRGLRSQRSNNSESA